MTDFALITTQPQGRFAFPKLSEIVVGKYQPRTRFEEPALLELADSIKTMGILHPILVRPLPSSRLDETFAGRQKGDPLPAYELVSGERRWRASAIAGLDAIPVLIRNLTDEQIPRAQLIENIGREDLTPLELGYAYERYMKDAGLTALEVADNVGCSRTHVYDMLKLITLQDNLQKAIYSKAIEVSAALLIARIPDYALQAKALSHATTKDEAGHTPSIRTFQAWLRDNVMLDLGKAPFSTIMATLTPAGSCKDCTTRTGHDPDLFADVKSDMCTHPPCYHIKVQAHKDALAAQVAAIPKTSNRNVDEQQGLGLVSTLAQDARAQQSKDRSVDQLKFELAAIKAQSTKETAAVVRIAIFDAYKDHIKSTQDEHAHDLIAVAMLRAWLVDFIDRQDEDGIGEILDITIDPSINSEYAAVTALQDRAVLRVQAASDADIYRYTALAFLLEERVVNNHCVLEPTPLFDAFASEQGFDIGAIRVVAQEEAEDAMKEKIAAINKQIKDKKAESAAPKTTSTPPPAGAAIGTGEADAKKSKPAASPASASRKAKTTAQEAISGIAAAMQSMEAEPLGASLGGSEAAAGDTETLVSGAKVNIKGGKHTGKQGVLLYEIHGGGLWTVSIGSGFNKFAASLATKWLEVTA